jgi:hypothetical protein
MKTSSNERGYAGGFAFFTPVGRFWPMLGVSRRSSRRESTSEIINYSHLQHHIRRQYRLWTGDHPINRPWISTSSAVYLYNKSSMICCAAFSASLSIRSSIASSLRMVLMLAFATCLQGPESDIFRLQLLRRNAEQIAQFRALLQRQDSLAILD